MATAKRDLAAGERSTARAAATVRGKLLPAATSLQAGALPIGLAAGILLRRPVAAGGVVRWDDVAVDETAVAVRTRRELEAAVE